ncbi:MAG: hypothetical protein K2W78_11990 [Xanthobacteraceae bacterium]|nr:hypothetical protein [Xanthobacteraceae bacterium]
MTGTRLHRISFFLALGGSILLMICPFLLRGLPSQKLHAGLPVVMAGAAIMIVSGIGYRADGRILGRLLSLPTAWLLVGAGSWLLFS